MRYIILVFCLIYTGSVFSQQTDSATLKVLKGAYQKLSNSEEFGTPYATTANHDTLHNRVLSLIRGGNMELLNGIIQTKGFSDFIVAKGMEWGTVKDLDFIFLILGQILDEMPDDIGVKPSEIVEESFLGDKSRIEIWNYLDKRGNKKDFRVTFTNGQITNFMIWL